MTVEPEPNHRGAFGASTVTDHAGRFQVGGLFAGAFTVTAETQLDVVEEGRQVDVEAGESAEVELRLVAGSTLRGAVFIGDVPGADIWFGARPVDRSRAVYAATDENGRFVLGPVPRRPVKFIGAYRAAQGMQEAAEPERFQPAAAVEEGLVVRFPSGGTIRGRVVRGGKPVAGALVRCGQLDMTFAEESGRFTLIGLPAGTCALSAESREQGARSTEVPISIAVGEVKEVDLALTEEGSVSGAVVDERGEPVADVQVELRKENKEVSGRTDARGGFRAAPVEPGSYSVSVRDESFVGYKAAAPGGFPPIQVPAGANVEGIRLVVKRPRFRSIRGKVMDAAGRPVADARVFAEPEGEGAHAGYGTHVGVTDIGGRFTTEGLTEGKYTLRAATVAAEGSVSSIAAGAEGVVITLIVSSSIDGTLVGFGEGVQVFAFAPRGHLRAEVQGNTFRIAHVPAGEYQVFARSELGADLTTVTVETGKVAQVALVSKGVAHLIAHAIDVRTRQRLEGVRCDVYLGDDSGVVFLVSGADGARLRVPAGELSITCRVQGRFGQTKVSLAPGQLGVAEVKLLMPERLEATFDAEVRDEKGTVVVTSVPPESNAARAGFAAGDIIVEVDGEPMSGQSAFIVGGFIADRPPGSAASVTVRRGGETLTLSVVIQ